MAFLPANGRRLIMMLIVASCAEAIVKTVNNIQLPKHSSNNLGKEDMNPIATSSGLVTNATSVAPYLMRKSLRNDRADGTYSLIAASSNATVKLATEAESKAGGKTKEGVERRRSVIQIPLERYVNKERYHEILQGLKMRQQAMSLSLMEQAEVPLEQEILTEKHIATYYGRLKIGNTVFKVLFDTGSCEFWVPSSVCTTPRCKRHTRFPEEESVLDIATDQPMSIEYLSGKVLGKMVYETVQIGDLPIPNQVVGLADTVDIELMDDGAPKEACIEQFMFVPVTEKTYWTITLDDVTFTFRVGEGEEPVSMTLKPIDYILKFEISGNEDCVVGISPDKDTIWTLGQVFLRSFYTLFDRWKIAFRPLCCYISCNAMRGGTLARGHDLSSGALIRDEDRIGFARLPRDSFKALNVQEMRNKEVGGERYGSMWPEGNK
eukprot:jgi/Bigna1/83987/fgenesh1_pg.120_\